MPRVGCNRLMTHPFASALPAGMDCALSESEDRPESREVADAVREAVRGTTQGWHGQHPRHEKGRQAMQVKMQIKAGGRQTQHNETLVRVQKPTPGLKVKTGIKAGLCPGDGGSGGTTT